MARCAACGAVIAFGGVRDRGHRFCSKKCRETALLSAASDELPAQFVAEKVLEVHGGACPKCGGPGPVDVHTAHIVWSAFVVTTWKSTPQISCVWCGRKAKLWAMLSCVLFGWWGVPWGLLATPVQIVRNVTGMFSSPDPYVPSDVLAGMVHAQLAARLVEEDRSMVSEPERQVAQPT